MIPSRRFISLVVGPSIPHFTVPTLFALDDAGVVYEYSIWPDGQGGTEWCWRVHSYLGDIREN